jgi:hypothetical protein
MLEILKVDNIMKLKMAVFIHKIINCNSTIPPFFTEFLMPVQNVHSHFTRYSASQNLHKPYVRTNYGKFTFKYSATEVWQSVPTYLKRIPINSFKKQYKTVRYSIYPRIQLH